MKKLSIIIPILFLVLFSSKGFSQMDTSKQKSNTPLLDKYYPRAKQDTVVTKSLPKSTGVTQPATVINPAAPQKIEETKPLVVAPVILPATIPERAEIVKQDSIMPVVVAPVIVPAPVPVISKQDSILTVSAEAPVMTPISNNQIVSETTPLPLKQDTAQIKLPVINTVVAPPVKKSVSKPETPYRGSRLGSSSPLYRTWEKNNNGAGSVTTLPKG